MAQPTKMRRAGPRDLTMFATPQLWPRWPFLPVIRASPAGQATQCGVLYDARNVSGRCGYSATVFLANLCLLPRREEELLALTKFTYDTFDELAADGWCVD